MKSRFTSTSRYTLDCFVFRISTLERVEFIEYKTINSFLWYCTEKRNKGILRWQLKFARSKICLLISAASWQISSSRPYNDAEIQIFPRVRLSTTSRSRPSSESVSRPIFLRWRRNHWRLEINDLEKVAKLLEIPCFREFTFVVTVRIFLTSA